MRDGHNASGQRLRSSAPSCQRSKPPDTAVSAIYEGTVRHRRFAVRGHELEHRLALAYLDLEELPALLGGRLHARRPGVVRFRRSDYLGDRAVPLAEAVRDTVEKHTQERPQGPIRLLTHLRTCGHCFNPVSFYYCMDDTGEAVQSVVAEVTNTPWGDRHAYVLAAPLGAPSRAPTVLSGGMDKALHVSPFMDMDHRYEWRLSTPGETLSVHIASHTGGRLAFDATLALRRRALTRASLASVTVRYPFATVRVLTLIYAHAAALKLKGVPYYARPRSDAT
jgi:DUF1365 family protein